MPALGQYRNLVTLQEPGPVVPDADGGYSEGTQPLNPASWWCAIMPATAKDLEAIGAGSVLAQGTHIVKGPYHAGITTQAWLLFKSRRLNVVYVANREERSIETDLVCTEVVK